MQAENVRFQFQTLKTSHRDNIKMGLSDRDYYNEDSYSVRRRSTGMSAVAGIIFLNLVLYVLDQLSGNVLFTKIMLLHGELASNPLQWYRCLTYGFAHDPGGIGHILLNMLTLFFFGPVLERLYGKKEFLIFYLSSIILGGVVWNVLHFGEHAGALGASGGVTAVVILFACKFPKTIIYIYGIIPFPAWLAGVSMVLFDAFGMQDATSNIGHDIHLAGAVFAFFYFISGLRFSNFLPGGKAKNAGTSPPRDGATASTNSRAKSNSFFSLSKKEPSYKKLDKESLELEVDRILGKYSKYGKESLTKEEEATLYFASKEFQKWRE